MERLGPFRLKVAGPPDLFEALGAAIVYQQLSGKAAATIYGRFCELFSEGKPRSDECPGLGYDRLRGVGLSNNKALAVLDLAEHIESGSLPSLRTLGRLDDQQVIERLCRVRGIGPWTAQMFLLFSLHRLDVWPTGDLGVRAGFARAWGLPEAPSPTELEPLGDPYRPWRSVVAWYCWRAADTVTPDDPAPYA